MIHLNHPHHHPHTPQPQVCGQKVFQETDVQEEKLSILGVGVGWGYSADRYIQEMKIL